MKTTAKDLAADLHRAKLQYRDDIPEPLLARAKENNLLIVTGASDDLCEFQGPFRNEADCYEGGEILFTKDGKVPDMEEVGGALETLEEHLGFRPEIPGLLKIKAVWGEEAPDGRECSWHYKTDLPHATFDVMEDGDLYCIGMVIDLNA